MNFFSSSSFSTTPSLITHGEPHSTVCVLIQLQHFLSSPSFFKENFKQI